MKIYSSWFLARVVVVLSGSFHGFERGVAADVASQAAIIAERQEQRERVDSVSAKVEDLWIAQAAQQKRLAALLDEVSRSRMEADHGLSKLATRDEVQKLSESVKQAIKELDERREADRKLILEEIRKLAKMPMAMPSATPQWGEPKNGAKGDKGIGSGSTDKGPGGEEPRPRVASSEGYEYEVKKDETLSKILQAYNEVFKKDGKNTVTLKQILDLEQNKHVKPNALRVGQKIFIPDPPKK